MNKKLYESRHIFGAGMVTVAIVIAIAAVAVFYPYAGMDEATTSVTTTE